MVLRKTTFFSIIQPMSVGWDAQAEIERWSNNQSLSKESKHHSETWPTCSWSYNTQQTCQQISGLDDPSLGFGKLYHVNSKTHQWNQEVQKVHLLLNKEKKRHARTVGI